MAKKRKRTATVTIPKRAHTRTLPGLEGRTIKALDDVAEEYANIRDTRIELTAREHALKIHALSLMKKYDKVVYRHDGIEITVIPGEDDVKVKVKKADDDDDTPADDGASIDAGEFGAERRAAVDSGD